MVSRGSKANRKGRSKGDGQYWSVPYAMLQSPAWRSLGGSAVKVYLELRTRFNGRNNGQLSLSMDEAARLVRISKSSVKRALGELMAKGFIVETRKGQWYGRLATLYALTDRSLNGQRPTDAWKQWEPPQKTDPRYRHGTMNGADGAARVPRQ